MNWEAFLRKIADDFGLSTGQTEVFLLRFSQDNKSSKDSQFQRLLEDSLQINKEAYDKRKTEIYDKLQWSDRTQNGSKELINAGSHKAKKLLEWLEAKYSDQLQHQTSQATTLNFPNWQQVCREMWNDQKEKQCIRKKATAKGFEVNVYVGLGLVQREYQQRRRGNEHERSQIYGLAEEVIIERYPHDKFLTKVIDTDSNKHVAIIGEPGAGKTTLLAAIADHLLKPNFTKVPIFLSLAGLQQRTIQSYLIDVWLPEAFRLRMGSEIEESDRESFRGWMAKGEAWLLLDGVDEMGEAHPASALHQIKTQLTDWLGQVRVSVTCRLNVWDAQLNNPLEGIFDVFKTQDFEPEQVSDFIQQWFSKSRKPDRGEILQAKLAEPQRERIRELVRNPLRLSLLCEVFYTNPGAELPTTKAGLYEQFARYFYEWKWSQHSTTEPQQERLNAALGKLAIAGLDDKAGLHRFRLPEKAARQVMGNDEFELVEKLGWLNIVDQDADSAQSVYAFFHPTFQEYFAALAIDDWDDFLPRSHRDQPIQNQQGKVQYRVFDSHWEEAILLWLGRENILLKDKQEIYDEKNDFINTLISFRDSCVGFYWYQSVFFAGIAIAEFPHCRIVREIVTQIVEWRFGKFNHRNKVWESSIPLSELARDVLYKSNHAVVISVLETLIEDIRDRQILKSIDANSDEAHAQWCRGLFLQICLTLLDFDPENLIALKFSEFLQDSMKYEFSPLTELFPPDYLIKNLDARLGIRRKPDFQKAQSFFQPDLLSQVVVNSKIDFQDKSLQNEPWIHADCWWTLWHCAQNMSYPEFYEAWHSPVPDVSELDAVGDEGL